MPSDGSPDRGIAPVCGRAPAHGYHQTQSSSIPRHDPVIKLTRVFLNKLSRPTNNKPHPLLGMSSDNLLAIIRSTVRVAGKIEKFLHRMENDHASGARIDFEKFSIFWIPCNVQSEFCGLISVRQKIRTHPKVRLQNTVNGFVFGMLITVDLDAVLRCPKVCEVDQDLNVASLDIQIFLMFSYT
ncbi:hypothetical protein KEM48_008860 [Puccinia striiformis f. sp. tritici PST-130]|nr:hypothetical protein KEM48_008860 [Puccinia striiformis f. sp. tritici PST-130]